MGYNTKAVGVLWLPGRCSKQQLKITAIDIAEQAARDNIIPVVARSAVANT